jgi:hypothetical protein
MNSRAIPRFIIATVLSLTLLACGGGDDDDTEPCMANATGTFTMYNNGNVSFQLYVAGIDRGVLAPSAQRTTTVGASAIAVHGIMTEGPFTGDVICQDYWAVGVCENVSISCGMTVIE